MQAIKTFLVVSAIAVIAASPDLRADDAQLREALRKATGKAGGQTSVIPPAKPIPPAAPAPAPAPAAKPAPPVTMAVPAQAAPADQASKPLSAGEVAALKSALRQQSGQPAPAVALAPVAKPAPAPAPQPEPTPAPVAAPVAQPAVASVPPAQWEPAPATAENADALRGALRQKAGEIEPRPAASTAPAFGTTAPATTFAPIEAPASPIPAGKEQRLADLLHLYKANVITPADYHKHRAAILAE